MGARRLNLLSTGGRLGRLLLRQPRSTREANQLHRNALLYPQLQTRAAVADKEAEEAEEIGSKTQLAAAGKALAVKAKVHQLGDQAGIVVQEGHVLRLGGQIRALLKKA